MTRRTFSCIYSIRAIAPVLLCAAAPSLACDYHWTNNLPEPVGYWPVSSPTSAAAAAAAQVNALDAANAVSIDATVSSWLINTTGVKGKSTDATDNAIVSQINANVQQVNYTASSVYLKVTSIPDYNIGPFNNPHTPANANATFRITRTPTVQSGTKTATSLDAIGVLLNGVEVFNASDGQSFNNQNTWHNNAGVVEAPSLDVSYSHFQQAGIYHSHASPTSLLGELGASSSKMTLIGYAIDGYPIYGNYGPKNADGTGGMVVQTSSYQLRNITSRTTLADGTSVTGAKAGPAIDQGHPLGYFQEDYQYVAGSGTLDQYNGRFVVTPEYPQGTYAYFASVDATTLKPAYPYYVGPDYYGVVQTDNLRGGTITVPTDSIQYVPEPTSASLIFIAGSAVALRRKRPCAIDR